MAGDVKGIQGLKLEKMYAEFITSGALTDREVPLWKSFFVCLFVCFFALIVGLLFSKGKFWRIYKSCSAINNGICTSNGENYGENGLEDPQFGDISHV